MSCKVPRRIAALLFEYNDDVTKSARYIRTWPPDKTDSPATRDQYEDFYKRHGDGDVKLGEDMVTEDGKIDPQDFVFFEPEDKNGVLRPPVIDLTQQENKYEKLMLDMEHEGSLSLANAFAYLLRKARMMRYNSCLSMLTGLKNYHRHVFYSHSTQPLSPNSPIAASPLASPNGNTDVGMLPEEGGEGAEGRDEEEEEMHMTMEEVVRTCLELEVWLHSQQLMVCHDAKRAEGLQKALDSKLVKLLDEQLELVQKELLLRAIDIFEYPAYYKDVSERYLDVVHEEVPVLGFTQEEISSQFPNPKFHLGLEDERHQPLYRRIVSQAIDSYFYNDWNARMELWAFQKSPVTEGRSRKCMKFIASKPMGDLTDTQVPGVVYIATEVGVKLIAIKRNVF